MQVNHMLCNRIVHKNQGFSLIELLIVVAIILIIAAIAIPSMLRTKQNANEAAAVDNMRTITTAEAAYSSSFGSTNGFANQLAFLGSGAPGGSCDATHACLIDNSLGCAAEPCLRNGYFFFVMSDAGAAPFFDYAVTATPQSWAKSGNKNFCAAEDSVLRYEVNGAASKGSAIPHDTCIVFANYGAI